MVISRLLKAADLNRFVGKKKGKAIAVINFSKANLASGIKKEKQLLVGCGSNFALFIRQQDLAGNICSALLLPGRPDSIFVVTCGFGREWRSNLCHFFS